MNTGEDDDLRLQRASASLLSDFAGTLPRLLRKGKHGSVRQFVQKGDLYRMCSLIEPLQEDPQLLDTHLKSFIPPLVTAYLETIQAESKEEPRKDSVPLDHAICFLLNLFCKVRGEKVIKGFLNNEPRYLESIVNKFEAATSIATKDSDRTEQLAPWVNRYILLLWLSHLLLAPFPLASMSASQNSTDTSRALGITLPEEMPGITLRVLQLCFGCLRSASKERNAAAAVLVRLCVRPDMQQLGLLVSMIRWSLSFFGRIHDENVDIHQCLGILSFLSGIVASASTEETGPYLASIYQTCRKVLERDNLSSIKSSAVARKLLIKTLRNLVLHALQNTSVLPGLDTTVVLEEVIEYLLEVLADGDTPVRYGASKALSVITLKLDDEMAGEVVEAILGSLTENVFWQGTKRNVNSVDPLRWHGLTLTLSHLLYRKAVSFDHLPEVLNALLLSLSFEQRSPTGGSIGTNVRDAACFGIWALSRRYTTSDLQAIDTTSIRAAEHRKNVTIPQVLAIELVTAACLDPAGNIRRGSSAALQELIGRHPNTIEEGIPLVQVVDFHAVGLRQRAMCEVAIQAGALHALYWDSLFEHLLEWRGTGSLDVESRLSAAKAVGLLSKSQAVDVVQHMSDILRTKLAALKSREVEERQGLVMSLSALVATATSRVDGSAPSQSLLSLWRLLKKELVLEEKAFTSPALRPEYTAAAICSFLGSMSAATLRCRSDSTKDILPLPEMIQLLNFCLLRHEESVLEAIEVAIPFSVQLLDHMGGGEAGDLVTKWLERLENESSYTGMRCAGHALALGASFSAMNHQHDWLRVQKRIINVLTFRCTAAVAIEARTIALRAITVLFSNLREDRTTSNTLLASEAETQLGSAVQIALNDYTITERGDVGALVRLEALNTVRAAWHKGVLLQDVHNSCGSEIIANVRRLSLEKLDKMRGRAAAVLQSSRAASTILIHDDVDRGTVVDISSQAYFLGALRSIRPATNPSYTATILIGYVSSAGMASESVVQNARSALLNFVGGLPNTHSNNDDISATASISLLDIANCFIKLLKENITEDRTLLPLLETIAFLFDMQVLQRLRDTSFSFRNLLSYTQKAHFKSTHMQKLHLALDVYRGLGAIPSTRADTLAKVVGMLVHPFPKIRITAAETLWLLTAEDGLKRHDWTLPPKSLKPAMDEIKAAVTKANPTQ
ncbi:hypothetical protein ACN47E_009235 [Coniothyrium glycines]